MNSSDNIFNRYNTTISSLLRDPSCYIIDTDYLLERFWLVTVLGSTLSMISIIENIFLFAVFVRSRQHRNSSSLYLMLLALSDTFISGTYILIMSVKVLYQFTESVYLKRMWVVYLVPMMTMSHIAITTSSFLIVFATVERFCATVSHQYVEFLQNNRKLIAIFAVFIGVVTKGTLLLEIVPVYDADCADTLNEYRLEVTALVSHNRHYKLWRFWFRNIVTILFPFFTLMYLNARIVNELRKNVYLGTQSNSPDGAIKSISTKQRKARVRAATRTLVLVVSTYLLANMLNVIITIWEHTDATSLFTSFLDFYIISVDAVSLLTIVACALRLPIYASCQTLLRREMLNLAKRIFIKTKPNETAYLLDQNPEQHNNEVCCTTK